MNHYKDTINKIKADDKLINKTLVNIDHPHKHRYYIPVLAMCLMLLVFFLPVNRIQAETYISLDVNPSIQIIVDKNDKVIDVVAYNEDGEKIINDIDYTNHDYLDVCKDLMENKLHDYLTNDEYLLVSISNKHNDTNIYMEKLKTMMKEYYVNGKVQECDYSVIDDAGKYHMSIGKYSECQKLIEYDDELTIEDCQKMSIHEIHNEIAKHHSESNHHGSHHE